MIGVIGWKQLQIFIFHPSATFSQQSLGFIEELQCHIGFSKGEVDDCDIICWKGAVNIGDYFRLGHLLELVLNIGEMEERNRFSHSCLVMSFVCCMVLSLSLMESINHK